MRGFAELQVVVHNKRTGRKRNAEVHAVNPRPGVQRPGGGTTAKGGCRELVMAAFRRSKVSDRVDAAQ